MDVALTPALLNIYEASFLSGKRYVFSAAENGGRPQLYLTDCDAHERAARAWNIALSGSFARWALAGL